MSVGKTTKNEFVAKLFRWWSKHKLDYAWRKTSNPYKILIAELMLRKTTAKQVETLYESFLSKYPTIEALLKASVKELEDTIKPLGMERKRAVLLKALAEKIAQEHGGRIPTSKEELLELPGLGLYATNAILCFAYGKSVPLVDTNAVRVFQRFFGFRSRKRRPKDDPLLWKFASEIIPLKRAKEFNLAIIDFAHRVCTPRNPHCNTCSLNKACEYAKRETQKLSLY